jgi:hypothetical protein
MTGFLDFTMGADTGPTPESPERRPDKTTSGRRRTALRPNLDQSLCFRDFPARGYLHYKSIAVLIRLTTIRFPVRYRFDAESSSRSAKHVANHNAGDSGRVPRSGGILRLLSCIDGHLPYKITASDPLSDLDSPNSLLGETANVTHSRAFVD